MLKLLYVHSAWNRSLRRRAISLIEADEKLTSSNSTLTHNRSSSRA
jgi:hypothetical protein